MHDENGQTRDRNGAVPASKADEDGPMLLAHVGFAMVAGAASLVWVLGYRSIALWIIGFHGAALVVQLVVRAILRQHPWRVVRMTYFWTFAWYFFALTSLSDAQ